MIRISNIKTDIDNRGKYMEALQEQYGLSKDDILEYRLVKEAFDARKSYQNYVYTVDISLKDEDYFLGKNHRNVSFVKDKEYRFPNFASNLMKPPIIVGSGPCGLFAAYFLAKNGYNPILLERGSMVDERVKKIHEFWRTGNLDLNTNVQFGEGGAGTFSDGKLTTNIKNERTMPVLETFVKHGAPETILYSYQPHIGTDNLREVVVNMRKEIIDNGGEVLFNHFVTDIIHENGNIKGVIVNNNENIYSDNVLFAIGHSARETYKMLHRNNLIIEPKPFSIGLRIEMLQERLNESQYGELKNHPNIDVATFKLKYHSKNNRSAYSFCMCPGGLVVASSSNDKEVVTNGMSYYSRAGKNANGAILVGVEPKDFGSDHPLAGIEFQQKYEKLAYELGGENFNAPIQLVGDFLNDSLSHDIKSVKPSYSPGTQFANLNEVLPNFVTTTLREALAYWDNRIEGFAHKDNVLTGVETRSSSPIRIVRDKTMQTSINGLFVGGEGAGYAGGIMSAAVDGVRMAEFISIKMEQS